MLEDPLSVIISRFRSSDTPHHYIPRVIGEARAESRPTQHVFIAV